MKFDDIFAELGDFGPYQRRILFFVCLVSIPVALMLLNGVFILEVPNHRCAIPGLLNDTYKSQGGWHTELINRSVPYDQDDGEFSDCDLYVIWPNNSTENCNEWVYSKDTFESTAVTDLDLVCGNKELITYANMVLMGGQLFGSPILGTLSDVIGRKKVLLMCIIGQFVASLVTVFAQSYAVYVLCRFFTTFFGIGAILAAYVIGMEIVGPSKRKYAGILSQFFWTTGLFLLNGLAYGIRDWRYLQCALSAPWILLISYWWLLPESPRWLINKERIDEARRVIQTVASGNGVELSDEVIRLQDMDTAEGPGERICQMFTIPVLLIRSLIIFFNWVVATMVYFGLTLNVGALSGDVFLNFFFSSLVELAGYICCFVFLDVIGRKPLQCFAMILGGVACVATIFPVILDGPAWVTIFLSMIGKFGATIAFAVIYLYTAELFPTVVRNSGMGLSSFMARIGGVAAPYIAALGDLVGGSLGVALPLIVFGGVSVAAGLLALLLPETLGRTLPDSIEDAKNFTRQKKNPVYALNEVLDGGLDNPSGKENEGYYGPDD